MKKILTIALLLTMMAAPAAMLARTEKSAPRVVYTGEIAKKVVGYNGTTPLNITITDGRVTDIEALTNKETPSYFNRATAKVFPQFIGKTVAQALKLDADVATGATYSSEALIKNIQMGLKNYQKSGKSQSNTSRKGKSSGRKARKSPRR